MTIAPQQEVNVSIRAVIGDRDLASFGFDKFEVLWKVVPEGYEADFDKRFWQNGATRAVLGVTITNNAEFTDTGRPPSQIGDGHEKQEKGVAEQVGNLDYECRNLQSRIQFLKRRNDAQNALSPRNFIIVGAISFVIGFIFA